MKLNDSHLVILDTSAFVEANQNPTSIMGKHVFSLIESGLAAITPMIRWEIGRRSLSKKQKIELQEYLKGIELLTWDIDWKEMETLDALLRKAGYLVPLTDLWIAQTALVCKAFLLHRDTHYDFIALCTPLKIWNPS